MSTFQSSDRFVTNTLAAGQYLLTRRGEAEELVREGITNLPYVQVVRAPNGGVLVGNVWCASGLCAAAYILAKFW